MNSEQLKKLDEVTQLANEAFWAVVAQNYPDAKSGDLSPKMTFHFDSIARDAVEEWVRNNVEKEPNALRIELYQPWWGAEADAEGNPLIENHWYIIGEFDDCEMIVSGPFGTFPQALTWKVKQFPTRKEIS